MSTFAQNATPSANVGAAMTAAEIAELERQVEIRSRPFRLLQEQMHRVIVGQEDLLDGLVIGMLANGHILIEGVPGLAKTTAVACLAAGIHTQFQRIQFRPDLLPADLIGTPVYRPGQGDFTVKKGPIFSNIVLADEINRAPAKVQSALLEAMQERQVTIGSETFPLPQPFLVLATQNPVEQEGTYPLPEAQVDRFMLKLVVKYPTAAQERTILDRMARTGGGEKIEPVMEPSAIGFRFRMVGHNPHAARTAGISVERTYVLAMATSAAFLGVAGANQALGTQVGYTETVHSGIGFDGITVALLGGGNAIGILFAGLLFGAFKAGGPQMQVIGVSPEVFGIVQGAIVLFIAAPPLVRGIFRLPMLASTPRLDRLRGRFGGKAVES